MAELRILSFYLCVDNCRRVVPNGRAQNFVALPLRRQLSSSSAEWQGSEFCCSTLALTIVVEFCRMAGLRILSVYLCVDNCRRVVPNGRAQNFVVLPLR